MTETTAAKTPATPAKNARAPARPDPKADAAPSPDTAAGHRLAFENGEYPYKVKLGRKTYEEQKALLQAELLKVQHWAQETGQKFVLLFEGRDAAVINGRINQAMRQCAHVFPIFGIKTFEIHLLPPKPVGVSNQRSGLLSGGI